MAMRPMMNEGRTITRTDLLVISTLLAVALLMMLLAQALGLNLL